MTRSGARGRPWQRARSSSSSSVGGGSGDAAARLAFASDNVAGVDAAVWRALAHEQAHGARRAAAYGHDAATQRAERALAAACGNAARARVALLFGGTGGAFAFSILLMFFCCFFFAYFLSSRSPSSLSSAYF